LKPVVEKKKPGTLAPAFKYLSFPFKVTFLKKGQQKDNPYASGKY
jgi:hypothetical protein